MTLSPKQKTYLREIILAFLALILIGGALALTFSHVLKSGPDDIMGRYDIYRYYGPITFYLDYCISQGELPLWNPLVYCGLPNAANPQAFVFYPPNLIRSLLLKIISPQATNESMIAFVGLHLLLMGFFTYLLGRAHKLSFPGALVAALAWVCSALIVRRACEYHFLYTMAWLPLILLVVKCAIDTPATRKKFAWSIGAGLLLGLSILGGFLQIVSYMGVCIGLYALLYRFLPDREDNAKNETTSVRGLSREVLAFGLIFFFAVLIALALLLPVAELSGFSARQKGMAVPMYSDMMKWDVTRIYQSIVVFAGMKYEAETLRSAGIIALLLALAGCFHRNKKLVLLFGLSAYALIDCGFGPPFPIASLADFLTPFSSSAYSRGFDFALLPLGLLAGLGVDTLWHGRGERPARFIMSLLLLYGTAATVIPLILWASPHPYLPVKEAIFILPLIAAAAMLITLWMPCRWRWSGILLLLFPVLLFGETWSWNREYVPWMIKKTFRDTEPVKQAGHEFPTTNTRTTDPIANRALYSLTPVMNGVDPLHFADVRNLLSGTPRDKGSHRLVTEWEPTAENHRGNLLLKRFFWLSRYAKEGPLPGKQALFPPTTTTYLPEGSSIDFPPPPATRTPWQSVSERAEKVAIPGIDAVLNRQRANKQRMIRFDIAVPDSVADTRAGSGGALHTTLVIRYQSAITAQVDTRITPLSGGRRVWGKRYRVSTSRNTIRTLEVPLPDVSSARVDISIKTKGNGAFDIEDIFLLTDPADEDALIKITSFTANKVELNIGPLPGPRLLTFLDAWYPGWHAYVDDQEVFILKADDVFKAIPLPEGTHTVRFEFRPRSVMLGVAGSLGGLLIALGVIAWLTLGRHKEEK